MLLRATFADVAHGAVFWFRRLPVSCWPDLVPQGVGQRFRRSLAQSGDEANWYIRDPDWFTNDDVIRWEGPARPGTPVWIPAPV